jgi:hypothetical protein
MIQIRKKKAKGLVEIRDYALWPKHIYHDQSLKEHILAMSAGDLIELEVDGFRGMWAKMDDGKDGRPTPGIKGIGKAREHWHGLQAKRGELVSIKLA